MTTYAEPIPEHCPPGDAFQPQGLEVFRLVETVPPTETDFQSHAVRWPERFGQRNDCIAWALSVYAALEDADKLRGLPAHSAKKVARLVLHPPSGVTKKSGQTASHYSWWRFDGFDPIDVCEVVE